MAAMITMFEGLAGLRYGETALVWTVRVRA